MSKFNRFVACMLWLALLALGAYLAAAPFHALGTAEALLAQARAQLEAWQGANATNFVIGQAAVGVAIVVVFGGLLALELVTMQRRGVRITTVAGGSAELDTASVGRRLGWHLDQLAEVIAVIPQVKSRGGAVDIRLEVETAPDIDVPMKTDEVVEVTREIIEQEMGLKLGKLDVHIRYAQYDAEWG